MPTAPPALSPTGALHFGRHLGAATRNDGHGVESPAGDNPRKRAENPTFFVGSRLLQRHRHAVFTRATDSLRDAGDVSGTNPREAAETPGPAFDPTSERRMLLAHVEEQEAVGDSLGLCGLPDSQEPQRRQTQATKAPVCRLASQRSPQEIRELYRTRFGIETSYRQAHQAHIYTCTRDPHLRLLFVVVALLVRKCLVWNHKGYWRRARRFDDASSMKNCDSAACSNGSPSKWSPNRSLVPRLTSLRGMSQTGNSFILPPSSFPSIDFVR